MKIFITAIIILFLNISISFAYCPHPGRAPNPPQSYEKPRPPACLANLRYNEKHDCTRIEFDRYRIKVEEYVDALRKFAFESQQYAKDAQDFAQCESEDLRRSIGQ